MTRRDTEFQTVRSEGGLLPPDLLRRILDPKGDIPGVRPEDYGLPPGDRLGEAITQGWNRLLRHWADFRGTAAGLREDEPGTAVTNDRWTLPLLRELGFGPLPTSAGPEIAGRTYAINRFLGPVPIHLVGCHVNLDRRSPGVRGAATANPHGLAQEFLNRSDGHLWAVVSNGLRLRLLRDSQALSRQSFLEFDLEAMFAGEVYSDFVLLWLTAHATRFAPHRGGGPETCRLEVWTKEAREQGARALGDLRGGVERALQVLGQGLTSHPKNARLRDALRDGTLALPELHGQLLRVVYRLIFLFAAEDRTLEGRPLIHPPDDSEAGATARERYATHYSTARLRGLAGAIRGSRHGDLWRQFHLVVAALSGDPSSEPARRHLALPALGGFLWDPSSTAMLNDAELANCDLLDALRHLAFIRQGNALRPVDYRNLGAEELGGVYESLLALTPQIGADGASFRFAEFSGNERKTTGSYYTPEPLVQCLLDSALDPVVEDAIRGKTGSEAEKAILDLKVCDPAAGSGHFLIGAARRLARHLARVRAIAEGESEPSPLLYQRALRDVIGRCIHGVDINPMAAELCRVGLWLEALEPGKPLSFLDHHIRVGDSLLGVLDPGITDGGIPGQAYKPLTGDDKAACRDLRKRNDRSGGSVQGDLLGGAGLHPVADIAAELDEMSDDTLADINRKQAVWEAVQTAEARRRRTLRADLFTGAFLAAKSVDRIDAVPITEDINRLDKGMAMRPGVEDMVRSLVQRHRIFHWPVEFQSVMAAGGFDVVLGNPPWEVLQFGEREYFSAKAPEIAKASGSRRKRAIDALRKEASDVWHQYQSELHRSEAVNGFIRESARYPLTAVGKLNSYALFSETFLQLLAPEGRAGIIVQSGIATDHSTRHFFREISEAGRLISLHDFENREGLFSDVDRRMKFCLLTLGPHGNESADFIFFATNVEHLADRRRRFTLSPDDIRRINPNTRTMPVFRSQMDAELTRKIYDRTPVLIDETKGEDGNPWEIDFRQGLFNMTSDSSQFHTSDQLVDKGARRVGAGWILPDGVSYVTLYEAKMIHQFDHRWATCEIGGNSFRDVTAQERLDPEYEPTSRYWVSTSEVSYRLEDIDWNHDWFIGWRDITNITNKRTVIAAIFPKSAANHKIPIIFSKRNVNLIIALYANLLSLVLDYIARQKIGGTSLAYFYLKQLPILPPSAYDTAELNFIVPRVLELTYTSGALRPFAKDLGYEGDPFTFNPDRRATLRAELDAFYARLYGLTRDELRFILDPADTHGSDYPTETFRVLKKNEMREFGEYRTQRLVLEAWDRVDSRSVSAPATVPARVEGSADTSSTYSVFCNESWHTIRSGGINMTVGALVCPLPDIRSCAEAVRSLKVKHGLATGFEAKWTKVSPAKAEFYMDLVDLFLRYHHLRFFGAGAESGIGSKDGAPVSRDGIRDALNRRLLEAVLCGPHRYRVYLEVGDTRGGARLRRLREGVTDKPLGADQPHIERLQQIRSSESGIMQIADLLTGALAYASRGLGGNVGKTAVVARLRERFGAEALTDAAVPHDSKFNVMTWRL